MSLFQKYFLLLFALLGICFALKANNKTNDTLATKYSVEQIIIIGNKVTKRSVILRELTFKECELTDTLSLKSRIKQSELNLMNTGLFNFSSIYYVMDQEQILVYIMLTERWYIWPVPILEIPDRNPNIWLQKKDIGRLNYGVFVDWKNFRGRKETVQLLLRFGYAERYGLAYNIPNIGKKQRSGIALSYIYSRNHEIGYKSINNVLLFYKDENQYSRQEQSARLRYTYRKGIFNSHSIELRYNQVWVSDTIVRLAPQYTFNGKNNLEYFSLNYFFAKDHRDYKPYPLKGWIYTIDITQSGFSLLKDEDLNLFKVESGFRLFNHLGKRWYSGYGLNGKWSSTSAQPYYLQRGLGYSLDYIRGYEYYVMDGSDFLLFKSNIKYQLLKPNAIDFNYFKNDRFDKIHYALYTTAFFDAGYVKDKLYFTENAMNNQWQYSYGLGLDIVTYYDMIFRVEVARNKLKQLGLFFHFYAPI